VKFGITTLSYWPTRSRAIDAAVERASDFWSRAPRGFREIVVYAADEDGRNQVVWSSVARTATGRP
jgi:hypothetical protein